MKTTKLEKRIINIEEKLEDIFSNHFPHLKEELTETKTNIGWIMKIQWAVMSAAIGGLVVGLIQLLG